MNDEETFHVLQAMRVRPRQGCRGVRTLDTCIEFIRLPNEHQVDQRDANATPTRRQRDANATLTNQRDANAKRRDATTRRHQRDQRYDATDQRLTMLNASRQRDAKRASGWCAGIDAPGQLAVEEPFLRLEDTGELTYHSRIGLSR